MSLNNTLPKCQRCPNKNNNDNIKCPNKYQPLGDVRKTPSEIINFYQK